MDAHAAEVKTGKLTEPLVTPSKPCLPLTVTFVPFGALSLTSRLAVELLLAFELLLTLATAMLTLAGVIEVLVDELSRCQRKRPMPGLSMLSIY